MFRSRKEIEEDNKKSDYGPSNRLLLEVLLDIRDFVADIDSRFEKGRYIYKNGKWKLQ